jgi:hypothetical protein
VKHEHFPSRFCNYCINCAGCFHHRYDWAAAKVPSPLTEELEQIQKARNAERRKVVREAKKEKDKAAKAEAGARRAEEEERRRFLNLTEREKVRYLAVHPLFLARLLFREFVATLTGGDKVRDDDVGDPFYAVASFCMLVCFSGIVWWFLGF